VKRDLLSEENHTTKRKGKDRYDGFALPLGDGRDEKKELKRAGGK